MTIEELLQQAVGSGELVRIVYLGGSQPGRARDIAPIWVRDGKVRAHCMESDAQKTFLIEKIRMPDEGGPALTWDPDAPPEANPRAYQGLDDVLEAHGAQLREMGWHVELGADQEITLHRRFKNGKPQKTARVGIAFEEYTWSSPWYEGGGDKRLSSRPWKVWGEGQTTRNYAPQSLDRAAATFLEFAATVDSGA